MNPEKLKTLFKKIQAWVKKNPKKAALAGVVIGIVVYFAIKQGAESDGESIGGGEPASDASGLDSFGAGLGAGGGESSAPVGGGSGGGSSGGGISNETTPLTNVTGSDFTSAGGFDSSSFGFGDSFLPEFPASGFVNSSPALPASSESIVTSSPAAAVGVGAIKPPKIERVTSPAPFSAASVVGAGAIKPPKIERVTSPAPVSKPAPAVGGGSRGASGNASKTDAERAGLSKYFTGVSGGKRYTLGKYTGMVSTVTTKPTAR